MALTVLTNVASLQAQRNLNGTQNALAASIGRLSSGMRINSAADDAAGLGISESLKAKIRGYTQAQRNANDAISLTQVTEGAMDEIQGIVVRMKELAVQSANGSLGTNERAYIATEFSQLRSEINRIGNVTEFAGQKVLDGTISNGVSFQIGIGSTSNDRLTLSVSKLATTTLKGSVAGVATGIASVSLSSAANARKALAVFDSAIKQLSKARANVGALQNRMQSTINNLATTIENMSAANSRIRDVDVASETASLTKSQILSQAGLAVLAQANALPQSALSLLR